MNWQQSKLPAAIAAIVAAAALAACSGTPNQGAATSHAGTAGSTAMAAASANPSQAAVAPAASTQTAGGVAPTTANGQPQYLYNLLQRPAFASAFGNMDRAAQLPAWVKTGGTATPARTVNVDGNSLLMAQACKPHACPSQQIIVLYDRNGDAMQGVFVDDPTPGPDAGISDNAKLTWLGKPDDAVKAWLTQRLKSPQG